MLGTTGFGIDKELKFPKGTYESTFEETASTKIYYYCPDGDGKLEIRETTPDLVEKGYTAAQTAALGLSDPMFAVDPTDYGLPPCPESARNETVTTGARLPRPDAETRARALPPLTRPPPLPRRRALLHLRQRDDLLHAGRVRPRHDALARRGRRRRDLRPHRRPRRDLHVRLRREEEDDREGGQARPRQRALSARGAQRRQDKKHNPQRDL